MLRHSPEKDIALGQDAREDESMQQEFRPNALMRGLYFQVSVTSPWVSTARRISTLARILDVPPHLAL